jgi:hypothetical protein
LAGGLVADIATGNSGQETTSLGVTERNNEPVDAVVLSIDDCLANSDYALNVISNG